MIGTPEYKLAKFLDTNIKPYIPNKYVINSTDDFFTQIKDFSFTSNQFLVSFDAKSLFTNVPLNYTIDIIADYIFSSERKDQPPIKREIFIKLMHLATQGMFLYNNKLYKQIDGVAMGSPWDAHWQISFLAIWRQLFLNSHLQLILKCIFVTWTMCLLFSMMRRNVILF